MNSANSQFTLNWLHDIIEDNYVLCYVIRFIHDFAHVYKCCKCRLYKKDGEFKLKVFLPDEVITIKYEDGMQLGVCDGDSIFIDYKNFPNFYQVRIFPVKRVIIPDSIIQASDECYMTKFYEKSKEQ